MSKSSLVLVGLLALAFCSGVGVGLFLGGNAPAVEAPAKNPAPTNPATVSGATGSTAGSSDSFLKLRIHELEDQLAAQKGDQEAQIQNRRLVFFKRYLGEVHLPAFTDELKISSAMVELLGLTTVEQQAVELHLRAIANEMEKLEQSKVFLSKHDASSVTYEIPAYPEGQAIKTRLNELLDADIGSARAELIMSNGNFAFGSPFSNFGEDKREIEIKTTDRNGVTTYAIRDSYAGLHSNGSSMSYSQGVLPNHYQQLLHLNATP